MEKINAETLIIGLFLIGFDRIDPVLFTYVLGKLSIDNQKLKLFEFSDSEIHQVFNKYVDYDGITFKLKNEISVNTINDYKNKEFYLFRNILNQKEKLIEYLSQLDFSKIVLEKVKLYDIKKIEKINKNIFSNKEIEILQHLNFEQNDNKTLNLKK